jgi:glycosyltransferase involved in cell wall biosynthesis
MTIDIMLPYYGDFSLLQETVRSVLAQDDGGWRLTVVDDGYPDDSVATWFAGLPDPRVRYHRNQRNLGANRNFQKCVDLIEHDVVVFMGADDVMLPHYVRTIRETAQRCPSAAIIQPGVELIDEHGRRSRSLVDAVKQHWYAPRDGRTPLGGEDLAVSLMRGNWLYFPSVAWRAAPLRRIGFREGLSVVQDLALAIDIIERGGTLVRDERVCFRYRRHQSSDSSSRAVDGTRFVEERRYFLDAAARFEDRGWPRAARAARHHVSSRLHALTLLPTAIRSNHRDAARMLVRHAFGSAT